jgi:hypothetical protein
MKWGMKDFKERPEWSIAVVILAILLIFVGWGSLMFEEFMETRARDAVLSALNDLSADATITVNGEPRQTAPVLEALRRTQHIESHHSYPLKPIEVEIRDGPKTIKLVVAQDSERSDEYWVYRPGPNLHNDALGEFLGSTQTQVFRNDSQRPGK